MRLNELALLGLLMALMTAGACANTFHGAGRDIENMGEGIQQNVEPQP